MQDKLKELLIHLAATLDPAREREIAARHAGVLRYEPVERPPVVAMYPFPADSPWQPELNDVDAIYAKAAQRKVPLIRVAASAAELISGRILERFPTGAALLYRANSFADAKSVVTQMNNARRY